MVVDDRLLDILAGRRRPSNDDALVLLNGQPLLDNYQLVSGYVIQVRTGRLYEYLAYIY